MGKLKGQREYKKFLDSGSLSPKQAIIAQCYVCNGEEEGSGEDCKGENCPLYGFFRKWVSRGRQKRSKSIVGAEIGTFPLNRTIGIMVISIMILTSISGCVPAWADTISIAKSEIGKGEWLSNNHGPAVRKYLNGQEGLPWCAGFVSYVLQKDGYKLPYTLRARDFLRYGHIVKTPKRGDLMILSRNGGGHVAIVETGFKDRITVIEGNVGSFPSKVKRTIYQGKIKNLVGFMRIEKVR